MVTQTYLKINRFWNMINWYNWKYASLLNLVWKKKSIVNNLESIGYNVYKVNYYSLLKKECLYCKEWYYNSV